MGKEDEPSRVIAPNTPMGRELRLNYPHLGTNQYSLVLPITAEGEDETGIPEEVDGNLPVFLVVENSLAEAGWQFGLEVERQPESHSVNDYTLKVIATNPSGGEIQLKSTSFTYSEMAGRLYHFIDPWDSFGTIRDDPGKERWLGLVIRNRMGNPASRMTDTLELNLPASCRQDFVQKPAGDEQILKIIRDQIEYFGERIEILPVETDFEPAVPVLVVKIGEALITGRLSLLASKNESDRSDDFELQINSRYICDFNILVDREGASISAGDLLGFISLPRKGDPRTTWLAVQLKDWYGEIRADFSLVYLPSNWRPGQSAEPTEIRPARPAVNEPLFTESSLWVLEELKIPVAQPVPTPIVVPEQPALQPAEAKPATVEKAVPATETKFGIDLDEKGRIRLAQLETDSIRETEKILNQFGLKIRSGAVGSPAALSCSGKALGVMTYRETKQEISLVVNGVKFLLGPIDSLRPAETAASSGRAVIKILLGEFGVTIDDVWLEKDAGVWEKLAGTDTTGLKNKEFALRLIAGLDKSLLGQIGGNTVWREREPDRQETRERQFNRRTGGPSYRQVVYDSGSLRGVDDKSNEVVVSTGTGGKSKPPSVRSSADRKRWHDQQEAAKRNQKHPRGGKSKKK